MGKGTNMLYALLAGAAAGIAIGVLLSSEKHAETRQKITDSAKKLADGLIEKAESAIDKMTEKKTNV